MAVHLQADPEGSLIPGGSVSVTVSKISSGPNSFAK